MNITLSARYEKIPQNAKDYALEKAEKLEKFYRLGKTSLVMDVDGESYSLEIVVTPERGGKTIVANAKSAEWFSTIDQALEKIERQLRKTKEKVKERRGKKQASDKSKGGDEDEETYEDVVDQM